MGFCRLTYALLTDFDTFVLVLMLAFAVLTRPQNEWDYLLPASLLVA